ncbi:naphthoate synthase [Ectocarpus siliculosus]|uniref:Naphthoate synthase n=1 Tax=Ectocarpus siliculosus TaxID=2880 RepID=D7FHN0_ECTSI|nr:naphthoate synthase [Ectocarpus siliculosus]|eukprot:CBJ28587.1 naphthoate synthase [Ectocarpus siliculosus]
MAAKRPMSSLRPPTLHADGFREVSGAAAVWTDMTKAYGFIDITYKVAYEDMTAKIAINRPELHNAFRPITVNEMRRAMDLAQDDRLGKKFALTAGLDDLCGTGTYVRPPGESEV